MTETTISFLKVDDEGLNGKGLREAWNRHGINEESYGCEREMERAKCQMMSEKKKRREKKNLDH